MGPQYKHPTCTWQRIWAGAYYFKPKIHHLRNYTGGQSINIRKREDQGQTQQTSLWNSKSYCRAVTINYFLMYQWSCWCWAAFHFEIFWAEFHPQYFRLLSISSEYSARLFAAGFSISHRIKIKLTSRDFCKRVRSDLFLTAGLGLYTSPLKMCNTSLKSSCSSSFPASLTLPPFLHISVTSMGSSINEASPIQQKPPASWSLITENILINFCLAMAQPNWAGTSAPALIQDLEPTELPTIFIPYSDCSTLCSSQY